MTVVLIEVTAPMARVAPEATRSTEFPAEFSGSKRDPLVNVPVPVTLRVA